MKLLAIAVIFIFMAPFATAFDIGGFEIKDGNLIGRYHPSGLEGCTISCYSNNKHVIDLIYKNKSIDITFEFLNDPLLKKLVSRDIALKDEIEKTLMNKTLHIRGAKISFEYEGCNVELHDIPTRFLRIDADKVVIRNDDKYVVHRVSQKEIKLQKKNFTAILMSKNDVEFDGNNITAYGNILLVSFAMGNEKVMKNMENAFLEKSIGGEVFIAGREKMDNVSYFGNVSIKPSIRQGKIVLRVSGDEHHGGKVIKVDISKNLCFSKKIIVTYDGRVINEASNITDVLNPNDDGSNPEYYQLYSPKEGMFLLISIPHFSEHEISIEFVVSNPLFKAISIAIGIAIVAMAAIYIFKP